MRFTAFSCLLCILFRVSCAANIRAQRGSADMDDVVKVAKHAHQAAEAFATQGKLAAKMEKDVYLVGPFLFGAFL